MGTLTPASNFFPDSQGLLLYLIFKRKVEKKRNMIKVTCPRAV